MKTISVQFEIPAAADVFNLAIERTQDGARLAAEAEEITQRDLERAGYETTHQTTLELF